MSFLFSSAENEPPAMKLSPVKSNIEEANKHIQALCEHVAHLESEKDSLVDQLQQKHTNYESLKRTLDQCQEHLSHRDIQTKNLQLTAASREEIILELESHLVAHQRESQTKSEALTSLETLLAEKETVFERISSKVTEYQRVLEVKNQLLETATENAVKLEEENVSWKQKEYDLREIVEILEEENQKLTKDRELKNSRSTVALEKILAYSSSIEGLFGLLKEASMLPEETEEEDEEKENLAVEPVVENGAVEALIEGGKEVHSPTNELQDECGKVITNGWSEAVASIYDLPVQNDLQPIETPSNAPFVPVVVVDDEVTSAAVTLDENSVVTHFILEATDKPKTSSHNAEGNLDDVVPEKNPFPVASPVSREAPSRVRGEDRMASILLFDSAEATMNGSVDEIVDDKNNQLSRDPVMEPLEEDEESEEWEEVNNESVQHSSVDEVVTNGFYERESYSVYDPDSTKINSTEFFV